MCLCAQQVRKMTLSELHQRITELIEDGYGDHEVMTATTQTLIPVGIFPPEDYHQELPFSLKKLPKNTVFIDEDERS